MKPTKTAPQHVASIAACLLFCSVLLCRVFFFLFRENDLVCVSVHCSFATGSRDAEALAAPTALVSAVV